MKLTIVGSAAAYTLRPGHASACYLVEADGEAILLDLGQGAFSALGAYREPSTLGAVFISHLHPDHGIDVIPLRHYLRYACSPPREVALHAPSEFRARIDALQGEPGFLSGLPGADIAPGTARVGGFAVEARPVTHSLNSFGFRLTREGDGRGRSVGLVYSGDCGRPEDVAALIRPGDTLLCEASWGATVEPPDGAMHLNAEQAATIARDGGAARLLLTHVLDEHDPASALDIARRVFAGPTDLAEAGMSVETD